MGKNKKKEAPKPTRRNFLWYVAGATLLGAGGIVTLALRHEPTYSYKDLKAGRCTTAQYSHSYIEQLPCFKEGVANGEWQSRILCEPDPTTVENAVRPLLTQISGVDLEAELRSERADTSVFKKEFDEAMATLVPQGLSTVGTRVPRYLVIKPNLAHAKGVVCDGDVESMILHEYRHALDFNHGIELGGLRLDRTTITPDKIRVDFSIEVCEVRALYDELANSFKDRVTTGSTCISPKYFGGIAKLYRKHVEKLQRWPANELEQKVREELFVQTAGVELQKSPDGSDALHFRMYGSEDTANFKRTE